MPTRGSKPAVSKPPEPPNTQDDCPLFKLAAETRNQIYELLFTKETIETNEDGSIDLNEDTVAPSNALLRTCRQIYNESCKVYGLVYDDYLTRTFVIDVPNRKQPVPVPTVSKKFFRRIKSFRVNWNANEHNKGNLLRFTSHFDKVNPQPYPWRVRVELHDEFWCGKRASDRLMGMYTQAGSEAMEGYRGRWSASLVARLVHWPYGPKDEPYVWGDEYQPGNWRR